MQDTSVLWFPKFHQLRWQKNSNWLNSLWLGWAWSLVLLPQSVVYNLILPLVSKPTASMVWWRVRAFVAFYLKCLLYGPLGWINTDTTPLEEMLARLRSLQQSNDDNL